MKRIAIIGCCGTGKSTLALKLGKILNLPVYHLDKYYWKPNWQERELSEYKAIHDELCNKHEWIIEGMNSKVMAYRLQRADTVIFLDFPRHKYIWNIFKRTYTYYGKEHAASPEGCAERFNFKFIKFLLWAFNWHKNSGVQVKQMLKNLEDKQIYTFKNYTELDQWLANLKKI